ncbi:hypothetical protein ATCC90586_008489 [Pythium insidiosum]|nr:hypothetical protein ATCC90586_008489 [Pythium insidiosum]
MSHFVTHGVHFESAPEAGDFLFGSVLGQGSYAKVFHARHKKNKVEFAVKVMDQNFIRKENKTAFVLTERKVLSRLHHPNIVRFYCSFKDSQSLYLVMELCKGGDLFGLINEEGHIKITDFGTAKDQEDKASGYQFCGTVSYVSPEVLNDKAAGRPCDLWALGCVVYQMLSGRLPFVAENDYLTFQLIINHCSEKLEFPDSIPESARNLIRRLLVQEPEARLGAEQNDRGYIELRNHPFFVGIEWDHLDEHTPPYRPPALELPEPRLQQLSTLS